jgi:hypothetical protein
MKVTRRQLRNLINEVLHEQGTDTDTDTDTDTIADTLDTKENDKKLFLYLNQVGKTARHEWLKWTFSLSADNPGAYKPESPSARLAGEIHFIEAPPTGYGGANYGQGARSREEQKSAASDELDTFNKKHGTTYKLHYIPDGNYKARHGGPSFLVGIEKWLT